ncbi:MAG: replication factor C large subunit [Candidatus Micrarchaeaceae archaeon]|nr:replication factor C large subunit [Candidatus Micrarchaeota archaeon]HII10052.1 replication factor C large subunit [Candidatus Micrarchaeota archaeon]
MAALDYDLYSVDSLDGVLGNEHQIAKLRSFASAINKGRACTPLLIYGPTGTGKSLSASLLAKENGWNMVELNASDYRDRETIESRMLSAATSRSLFGNRNLILLDEIDETASGFDKGAAPAINSLITKSKSPIIFIANDMWDQSISFLRGKAEPVEFKRLAPDTVQRILFRIVDRFKLGTGKEIVDMIANRANGDARSAINDLSVLIGAEANEEATEVIGLRDRKSDIFHALDRIFLTNTIAAPLRAVTGTDVTNDMLIKWLDENIPKRYTNSEDMCAAFDSLASASTFAARAQRSQYYTYWRYMNVLMSSGVALSKRHLPESRAAYSFPRAIKELSGSKASRGQARQIAAKLQRVFHSSASDIIRGEMRMLSRITAKAISDKECTKEEAVEELGKTYTLDEKEVDYMLGMAALN